MGQFMAGRQNRALGVSDCGLISELTCDIHLHGLLSIDDLMTAGIMPDGSDNRPASGRRARPHMPRSGR